VKGVTIPVVGERSDETFSDRMRSPGCGRRRVHGRGRPRRSRRGYRPGQDSPAEHGQCLVPRAGPG
jgi:hypothetical protein